MKFLQSKKALGRACAQHCSNLHQRQKSPKYVSSMETPCVSKVKWPASPFNTEKLGKNPRNKLERYNNNQLVDAPPLDASSSEPPVHAEYVSLAGSLHF
jgi:hypothetical protein